MTEEERSAVGKKAAATKKANGTNKLSDEAKRKISESRKKAIAEGRIVPWNKGKAAKKLTNLPNNFESLFEYKKNR
jgi:hypothetical protein